MTVLPKGAEYSPGKMDYFRTDGLITDLKGLAIRSGGITLAARVACFLIQTIATLILARILSPEEFGLLVMVTALGGFLLLIMDFGLTDAIIQKKEIHHGQISSLFWMNLFISIGLLLLVCLFAPFIAWFYSEPRLVSVTILWSTFLLFGALSTQHLALLKRKMLFLRISIIEIAAGLFSSLLAILLAQSGWSYWSLAWRQVFLGLFLALGAWMFCHWRPGKFTSWKETKTLVVFGRNTVATLLLGYFAGNLDKILVGWKYGASELGYYHKAFFLFLIPASYITESLKIVAVTTLSKIKEEPDRFKGYYLKSITLLAFVGMPMGFFFFLESRNLVFLLLGPRWEKTVDLFSVVSVMTGVWMIYTTKYWLHASLGRTDRMFLWGVVDFVVLSLAALVGLPFGPKGVAVAHVGAVFVLTFMGLRYAGKPIGLTFGGILSSIWRFFLAALASGILIFYFQSLMDQDWNRFIRLVFSFLIYTGVYFFFLIFFFKSFQPFTETYKIFKIFFSPRAGIDGK